MTIGGIASLSMGLLTSPSMVSASDDLHIEMTKKGLGKEVVITQGAREWFPDFRFPLSACDCTGA